MINRSLALTLALAVGGSLSCGDDPVSPDGETVVTSIVPNGGATEVDPGAPIVLAFSHPMRAGAEMYVALHEGDVTGPEVPGMRTWSADRTQLTFTPDAPLRAQTQYTLHVGGNMRDAAGHLIGYEQCLHDHGGQWATQEMMGGGMMGGEMAGLGWKHPNGSYGMVFSFTTR